MNLSYVVGIACFQHVHVSFFYWVIDYPADLSLFHWKRCVAGRFAGYSVSEWVTVNMVSDHSFWKLRKKKALNSLPQQNIFAAFVRIILFILMQCRELFLLLSHILPVTTQSTSGELISLWIASTCDHWKPPGCSEHESWIFLQLFKIQKCSVVVWPLDFLTCLFMNSFDYFEISQ